MSKNVAQGNEDFHILMTNEQYREELQKMFDGVEDSDLLQNVHTYTLLQIRRHSGDCHISKPDYGELIIEMVGKIEDERLLKYFYIFMSEKLKRAL